jgi:NADP-reducing hydrogenase subunit HndB
LREKLQAEMQVRNDSGTKVVVGMGTCGIAAGAREVMAAILDEIAKRKLQNVHVEQTGCIGMCEKEVLVDVIRPGEDRITYGKVKPADAVRIIGDHVVNGKIVQDLVVGRIERPKK